MKNINDVLQQKEAEIQRLKEELRALSIVAPLLEEEQVGPRLGPIPGRQSG